MTLKSTSRSVFTFAASCFCLVLTCLGITACLNLPQRTNPIATTPGNNTNDWASFVPRGLAVTRNADATTRAYGWRAVRHSLTELSSKEVGLLQSARLQELETTSIAAATTPALAALSELYSKHPTLRRAAIDAQGGASPEARLRFLVAAAREGESEIPLPSTVASNLQAAPLSGESDAFVVQLLKYREALAVSGPVRTRILHDGLEPEHALAAAVVAMHPSLRVAFGFDDRDTLELLEILEHWLVSVPDSPPANAVRFAVSYARDQLTLERGDQLSMSTLLQGVQLDPIVRPDPVGDQQIVVSPISTTVVGSTPNAYGGGTTPSTVTLNTMALPQYFVGASPGYEAFTCLTVSTGSKAGAGSCYADMNATGLREDTPGPQVHSIGLQHRTWARFGSGGIRYGLRLGLRPIAEVNWFAVRWVSADGSLNSMNVTSGALSSVVAEEPTTAWKVFPVSSSDVFDVTVDFSAPAEVQGAFYGFGVARPRTGVLEVVAFDDSSTAALKPIEPLLLGEYREKNGLLHYVAGVQRALGHGQWLNPNVADPHSAAALFLVRLAILRQVAWLPIDQIPLPSVGAKGIMAERQAFLRTALPITASRVFGRHQAALEREAAVIAAVLPGIRAARKELVMALSILDKMAVDDARAVLSRAATVLGEPSAAPLTQVEDLAIAIVGAHDSVSALAHEQELALARRCEVLRRFSHPGFGGRLSMAPSPEVLAICGGKP